MPYVKQERRPALDEVVDELSKIKLEPGDIELFLIKLAFQEINLPYGRLRLEKALIKAFDVEVKPNGDMNYILFKYCKYHVKPSYNNYKDFMGEIYSVFTLPCISNYQNAFHQRHNIAKSYRDEFREAAEWIRIKLLIPYEEQKIIENGDV